MSDKAIVERILSDAQAEAGEIIAAAQAQADGLIAEAHARAERQRLGAEAEAQERSKSILDGKAATARLDSAKILLGEKRRVIDSVYGRAIEKLKRLGGRDTLALAESLLKEYAEEGDEIVFDKNFPCKTEVMKLSVVREKKLTASREAADIEGGMILRGKNSDKNLSYRALIEADREEHQSEIAAEIFITG